MLWSRYFDNTGGMILQTALFNMATHGRIVCCGNVSQYDTATPEPGPRGVPGLLVNNRVTMQVDSKPNSSLFLRYFPWTAIICQDWLGTNVSGQKKFRTKPSLLCAQGFLVSDWSAEDATAAKAELRKMIVDSSLKPWVNEFHGLEKGPEAFVDMLAGGNVGTTTVRLD